MRPQRPRQCPHHNRPYRALGLCRACYLRQNGGSKRWYYKHRAKSIRAATKWNQTHLKRRREVERNSAKRRYARDPQKAMQAVRREYHTNLNYRIAWNLRSRVRRAMHGIDKSASTLVLLGCSVQKLKTYLERRFLSGMSWANYGKYGWHLDHKKPCAWFDLRKPAQQRECFHYTNLQPLWAFDNQSKGGRR